MYRMHNPELDHTSVWAKEEDFWLEGPDFYRSHMAPDAEMTFPDTGTMSGQEIIDSLENAPRWDSVVFSDQHVDVGDNTVGLRYHATARREGQAVYEASCETTYRRGPDGLVLTRHVQRAA